MTSLTMIVHANEESATPASNLNKLTISVNGVLNIDTCAGFQNHIAQDLKHSILEFNLEKLHELDGNGLGTILTTAQCLMLKGKKVTLTNVNGQPKQLLAHLEIENLLS